MPSTFKTPGFRYPGSKCKLRREIVDFMPMTGSLYVEPFAGRANVFWEVCQRRRYQKAWLNDMRTHPFFTAIMEADLNLLPATIDGFDQTSLTKAKHRGDMITYLLEPKLCWSGGHLGETTFIQKGVHHNIGSEYHRARYYRMLKTCRDMLRHHQTEITGIDYLDLPWQDWQDPSVMVYLDPPYLGADAGAYSEKDFRPKDMIEILQGARFQWILSEYPQGVYYEAFGEPIFRKSVSVTMCNSKDTGGVRLQEVECLWSNIKGINSTGRIVQGLSAGLMATHPPSIVQAIQISEDDD